MNIHERSWPIEGLTRIPYWIYADRELYAEEQTRIFRGDAWTFLCLEAELPRPETFRTSNLGDMPVVVTRDADGVLQLIACCWNCHCPLKLAERFSKNASTASL